MVEVQKIACKLGTERNFSPHFSHIVPTATLLRLGMVALRTSVDRCLFNNITASHRGWAGAIALRVEVGW